MRLRHLFPVALLSLAAAPAGAMQLVSIQGVELDADSYVSGFKIETRGVRVLAVCSLPRAWTLTAGNGLAPSGQLAGHASGPPADLNYRQLDALVDLALIDDPPPPAPRSPPTFSGTITVGTFKAQAAAHDLPLAATNIVLTPAKECPRPIAPPAAPR